ncbi:TonB-dependent receptor [Sphingobium estronivorans]|uniref:TonB-dependent receptor n=1 Tax=Sphingobium estronivorans TaxID=1577690 RepID=UPI00196703A4|nr:TonB-dependent receptor [Sphingobium estronivorans]
MASSSAAGQTTKAAAPSAQNDTGEIVVTARQRNESLISAPVAVSAISGEQLMKQGTTDTRELTKVAPSLTIDRAPNGNGGSLSLRGIGTSFGNPGFDQAVSVNIDGIQTGRARIMMLGMLDLAQVEVMKGPQALFFGKNSPAGVVSLSSASPTSKFEGYARAGYEVVADEAIVEGSVSGPLSDAFGARLAVRYRNMDGWLRNTAGQLTSSPFAGPNNLPQAPASRRPGEEEFVGRVTLAYNPVGSPFSATLKLAGAKYSDDGPAAGLQLYDCGAFTTPVLIYGGNPAVAVDPFGDCKFDRKYSNGALPNGYADNWPIARQNPYTSLKMFLGSLQASYDAGNIKITSVTGLYKSKDEHFDNYDGTVYMGYDASEREDFTSFSQELRLLSTFDFPVNFMIGAYYQNTKLDFFNTALIALVPVDPATGKYHTWEKPALQKGDTYSAFGQLIWNIMPQLEFAGGVRYTREVKDSSMSNTYAHPPLSGTLLAPEGKLFTDRFTDGNYSPEATLTWRPTSDLTAFVAYKTGYKSGGYSVGTNLVPGTITSESLRFKSEKINGFEGGIKARLFDRRLTITSSIYSYKYSNLQVTSYDSAFNTYRINNAASARIKGAEVEFSARPNDWLTLNGAIAYNHARYTDYIAACWGGQTAALGCNVPNGNGTFSQDLSGAPLSRAPEWTGNAGFDISIPMSSRWKAGMSGSTRYSSKYFVIDNGNPAGIQPSFGLFDASVRVGSNDDRWEFAVIGRNLTDKVYAAYIAEKPGSPVTPGTTIQLRGIPNRGRQVLFQATTRF